MSETEKCGACSGELQKERFKSGECDPITCTVVFHTSTSLMKMSKNFLLIEHDGDQRFQIQGIVEGKKIHVHVNGKHVNYYEDTETHLEVKITEGLT